MWKVVVLSFFCMVVASPAVAQIKSQIQKVNDQFSEAFNKGDAAAIADNYTEDAVLLPPGQEMVRGRKEILAFWTRTIGQLTDLKAQTLEVRRIGRTYVREIGAYSFRTRGNAPQEIVGKYVVLWQKVAGRWKLSTDIWNTNK
jgi:uncharacterized protein (TIGR02246 family)